MASKELASECTARAKGLVSIGVRYMRLAAAAAAAAAAHALLLGRATIVLELDLVDLDGLRARRRGNRYRSHAGGR